MALTGINGRRRDAAQGSCCRISISGQEGGEMQDVLERRAARLESTTPGRQSANERRRKPIGAINAKADGRPGACPMHAATALANGGNIEKTPAPYDRRRGPHYKYIGLGADIQDGQSAEARRRRLALARLNRIASVAVLSASIAHELNQPLAAMLSNVEAAELCLETNPPDLPTIREILADIRRDDLRAADVLRNMRGLLTRDEFELQDVDLNDVVSAAHHILAPRAADLGIALRTEKAEHSLPVRANPVHLQQVLLNLTLNGFDATMRCPQHDRRMVMQTTMADECLAQVTVSDSGSGIPTDRLEKIFEPFFTTKPHGTGVGLSISREIIESCGGRLWAENRQVGGGVFRFTLPLTRAASS